MDEALIILARLVVPFAILRFPIFGTLASAFFDVIDHNVLGHYSGYQSIDKLLDFYYLSFCVFVVFSFKDVLAKKIAMGLYIWRLIGVSLLFVTGNEATLFFFPNLFEAFFLFYLIFVQLARSTQLFVSKAVAAVVLFALFIPKLFQEYSLHVYLPAPQNTPEQIAYIIENPALALFLSFLLPVATLAWCVWNMRRVDKKDFKNARA